MYKRAAVNGEHKVLLYGLAAVQAGTPVNFPLLVFLLH